MELNTNGVSARLYRWFYLTDRMPQSLCPYFWKLVIAYIFALPVGIIALPMRVTKTDDEFDNFGERLFFGAFLWVLFALAFAIVVGPISTIFIGILNDKSFLSHIQVIGFISLFTGITIAFTYGIIYLFEKRKQAKRRKKSEYIWNDKGDYIPNPEYVPYTPKPNIIVEFIKAAYNKYCPKIDWK